MIIDEIVLYNFGTYKGRHVLKLAPPSPSKPIILIGGNNGGGKTTLLDAFQLAFYGKLAHCSKRGNQSYNDFLRQCINRTVDAHEGASIEVQFIHRSQGNEHTYRIHRSWALIGNGIKEKIEVLNNGRLDHVLTGNWYEHAEEFIPSTIAHLFFFDGEKIEKLANHRHSAQLLSTAVHSLLGLDIMDKLDTDLMTLERRNRSLIKDKQNIEALKKIEQTEKDVEHLQKERDALIQDRASVLNELDKLNKQLEALDARFRKEGGELYEKRGLIEAERSRIGNNLKQLETEMQELAAGVAPLALVKDLLQSIDKQDHKEEAARQANILNELLTERDANIIAQLKLKQAPKTIISDFQRFFKEDLAQRKLSTRLESYQYLSLEAREKLQNLQGAFIPETESRIRQMTESYIALQNQLVVCDRKLSGIPNRDSIEHLQKELQTSRDCMREKTIRLNHLDEHIVKISREFDLRKSALIRLQEQQIEHSFEQDGTGRIINYSIKTRKTLSKFRVAVISRHIQRLEHLILDCFMQLLRKKSLVRELKIDPETFTVNLFDSHENLLSPDELSAGERQLLAASMLWGLSRASGRPLPTVIDTPLSRLDSSHRANLVNYYFPNASHQVLLLSTDVEIDQKFYETIKPWVGQSYLLSFDDLEGSTRVDHGYFW